MFKTLKKVVLAPFAALGAMFGASSSHAAIVAADLTTPLATITTDSTTIFDAVLPVMIGVLALVVGIKLVKRFVSKI